MIPSDSILHHNLKPSEAAVDVEDNPVRLMHPPPYSTAAHDAIHEAIESDPTDGDNRQAFTAIHVDASINVSGDGNSIVLPSPATGSASSASPATAHTAQRQRQARLADMTASILAALHRTGLLNAGRTSNPIEIHVAAGIKIEGSKNIICSGLVAKRPLVNKQLASVDGTSGKRRSQSVCLLRLLSNFPAVSHPPVLAASETTT